MVAAAASWAAATVLTKVTLHELAPLDLLGIETSSSAALLIAVLAVRGRPFRPRRARAFIGLGALEPALALALFDFGLARTGAADGALLIASESLFAVLFARIVLGERIGRRIAAVLVLGFAGSTLVSLGEAGRAATVMGDLLVLAASAAAAAYSVGSRRLTPGEDNLAATTTQLLAAAVIALPLIAAGWISGSSQLSTADTLHILAAIATGVLSGALPFLAFNAAIRNLTVAGAALILNLIPVAAAGLAVLLLGERLGWTELAGGVLVVLAAAGAGAAVDGQSCDELAVA